MATATISPQSPVPIQVRNYHVIGDTIFNQVEKVISGAVAGTTAEAAITAAIATINSGGSAAPTKWAAFIALAGAVIDCAEANNIPERRTTLWKSAKSNLVRLLDQIKDEEIGFQKNRGLFIIQANVINLVYFSGCLEEATARGQVLNIEAS
jgi:hypothetical protein